MTPDLEEALNRAALLGRGLEQLVSGGIHPRTGGTHGGVAFLLGHFARTLHVLDAVIELVRADHGNEAWPLVRSMYEGMVAATYVAQDPESEVPHLQQFVLYQHTQVRKLLDHMNRVGVPTDTAAVTARIAEAREPLGDAAPKFERYLFGVPLDQLADKLKLTVPYTAIYRHGSIRVHAMDVDAYLRPTPTGFELVARRMLTTTSRWSNSPSS